MGMVDGTLVKMYDLSAEIDRYSNLNDKLKSGKISASERKELRSMRKRMTLG
jgi:hypothetical protein